MTKEELIAFELEVAERYDAGEIKAPVHLSGGNEDELIRLFDTWKLDDDCWVLSTWRNHYHALLKGVPREEVMRQIVAGRSMAMNSPEHHFYSSSIAGGVLPIAVGIGLGIKRLNLECMQRVVCFVGDMVCMSGIFRECTRYARNFNLPVQFVVEDNGKSVHTNTCASWGQEPTWRAPDDLLGNVVYYKYELTWPHHGTGKWIPF